MKILLGGIPLGCDNIGDEAIVTCVVNLLRKLKPEAELTVCTNYREKTAFLLGVETLPLYGFTDDPDWKGFAEVIRNYDVYIWFGATGLSDYPENGLKMLDIAQRAGLKTIVWGVGMNSVLNPAFYRAAGRRLKLLRMMSAFSLHLIDFTRLYEFLLCSRVRNHIRRSLKKCALVVLRDAESVREVEKCGFHHAVTGADTAILLPSSQTLPLKTTSGLIRIGFCVSAQNAIRNLNGVKALWDDLLERPDFRLVLIPMNPKTDRELMLELASETGHPERIECLESNLPADVQACASQCRVVVSSRLHLLILASNVGVPGLGIERGSKIANWLNAFGRTSSGSVDNCDFSVLERQIMEIVEQPQEKIHAEIMQVRQAMLSRLEHASELLRQALSGK